jgi:hypothetical protein
MVNYSSQMDRLALVSAAALLLGVTLALDASGWQRPATPCPCAADGDCQPQGPWGHAPTKWRPWPGDTLGKEPPSAEEAETREELQLKPFERPSITKEGLRGPNITKPPKPKREEAGATEPAVDNAVDNTVDNPVEPAAPMPGDNLLEGLDPVLPEGQDDFNLDPPGNDLLLPENDPLLPGIEPQPGVEPPPGEANPLDEFDPFSKLDLPRSAPATRRTSLARPIHDDAPPQLPPSLRKLSRRSTPTRQTPTRQAPSQASRYRRPAMAMAQ